MGLGRLRDLDQPIGGAARSGEIASDGSELELGQAAGHEQARMPAKRPVDDRIATLCARQSELGDHRVDPCAAGTVGRESSREQHSIDLDRTIAKRQRDAILRGRGDFQLGFDPVDMPPRERDAERRMDVRRNRSSIPGGSDHPTPRPSVGLPCEAGHAEWTLPARVAVEAVDPKRMPGDQMDSAGSASEAQRRLHARDARAHDRDDLVGEILLQLEAGIEEMRDPPSCPARRLTRPVGPRRLRRRTEREQDTACIDRPDGAADRVVRIDPESPWALRQAMRAAADVETIERMALEMAAVAFDKSLADGDPGFSFTLQNFVDIIKDPLYREVAVTTFVIATTAMLVQLVVAVPLAYVIAFKAGKWELPLLLFLVLADELNPMVRIYAWRMLLGREGLINSALMGIGVIDQPIDALLFNQFAVTVVLSTSYLTYTVIPIYGAMKAIDRNMFEAALDLGAGWWTTARRVLLPLIAPGIFVALLLVYIPLFTDFASPELVGGTSGYMLGNAVNDLVLESGDLHHGAAMSMLMLAIAALFAAVAYKLARFDRLET